MAVVYLGLGSNLDDPKANLCEVVEKLSARPDVRVIRLSSLYLTTPIGFADQPDFLNAVAVIETDLSPADMHAYARDVEDQMGRTRNFLWGPRVIDVDLLLWDSEEICTPDLTIPHPRMLERAFVLQPLSEVAPDLVLPDGRRVQDVLDQLGDQGVVRLPETDQWQCTDMR